MFFCCFHTVVSNFPRRYIEREISGKETLTHRSLGLRSATACFHWQFVDAFTDTILQGQSLTTSQTIISAGANRDYSFTNPSVVLTVSTDGNLEILEGKFSYKSFDYPTDTLLPGMKSDMTKGGKTWSLVSWKSAEDPSPGDFSVQVDPNGTRQIFSLQGPNRYWTTGVWDGQIFSQIPEVVVDVSGQVRKLKWHEGTHEWDFLASTKNTVLESARQIWRVCEERDLQCVNESHANGERDQFLLVSNVRLPKYPVTLQARSAMECESICLNRCSCSAYAYEGECRIWGGDLVNVEQLPDGDSNGSFYIKLAASELNKRGSEEKVSISHGQKDGQAVQQFLGEDLLVFDFGNSSEDTSYELGETNRLWRGEKKEVDLPMFSFASVSASTNNFCIENKLGEGGFGSVYKSVEIPMTGKVTKRYEVAVKRLSKRSKQGWEELKNEAMLIAKLQHKNLVKVLGYCIERDEKILIYEYMSNKSLDFFLFDPAKRGILNWETRVRIIEGVAQGLLYLHQYSRLRVIHRDLKASNIPG
ncbi:G-type lectin S-receptor-like serine/threonine-protein kinase B120 [Vitis vinifera]|uniref:non-specific serine/threonine protein kinase n=1 Tax=Vitis vinifera TaxID=29760 RepID=A0A438G9P4_VITVI|nr:G-type lectin S-receptor-like serine/threonine-protein kinase B120 [Vitis vinifera]